VSISSVYWRFRRHTTVNPLVVALDTADLARLERLAVAVGPHAGHLKVGLEAFAAHGPAAARIASEHGAVFCDLKLHDIPNTVAGAAAAVAALGVDLLTVHASGGPAMVEAAAKAAPGVRILAVSVLTSLGDDTLAAVGQPPAAEQVLRLARVALDAGAAGVVCAPTDVAALRAELGPDALLVTPGVRPGWAADRGDQARVATPREALDAGADHLVVGRPITGADDPAAAARRILEEIA
jgi:orotidine-5'-phosphate decarboxylase